MPDQTDKSPAFQFYVKDFLSDADQAGMSLQETGAYIRLMCFEWNKGGKGIHDDPVRCARMIGASPGQMRRLWPAVKECFIAHPTSAGYLVHPRLEKEREKQASYRRRQSDKGKASAASRKATDGQPDGNRGSTTVQPETNRTSTNEAPEIQPKGNSSSASASASARERKDHALLRGGGLMAGHESIRHGNCLAHGPVCFRPQHASKYLPRFGGNHAAMTDWAQSVCEDWQARVERGEMVPEGDDFDFWAARYDDRHRTGVKSSKLGAAFDRAEAEFLKS